MKNLKALFSTISPRAGGQSVSKATSIPFVVRNPKDVLSRNGKYYGGAPPPVYLPSVYLTTSHMTRSPPPYLHTVSNQIVEVEVAREQG